MEKLRDYISFDLEFNKHQDKTHLIQVSAVRFKDGEEVGAFDSYVHTDVPLKSFINGLTGITSETLKDAPMVEEVLKNFQDFVGELPLVGYNAAKSDLPILLEYGLDYSRQYPVDLYDEAFLESDESRVLLDSKSSLNSNPFGGLDLSQLFD